MRLRTCRQQPKDRTTGNGREKGGGEIRGRGETWEVIVRLQLSSVRPGLYLSLPFVCSLSCSISVLLSLSLPFPHPPHLSLNFNGCPCFPWLLFNRRWCV